MWRQYDLHAGNTYRTGWLDSCAALKRGTVLTLKRDEVDGRRWTVIASGSIMLSEPPAKDWRVGGLD